MQSLRTFIVFTLLFVSVFGSLAGSKRKDRRAYLDVYQRYTRHSLIYFGFETALNLRGTLLDAYMRKALATERQRLMNPSPENHAEFVSRMDRDLAGFHELVFSADSAMPKGDRFGTTDEHWNLRLIADGKEEELVAIEKIWRPTPVHHALYPHLNQWSDLWIARFAKTVPQPQTIELKIGSGYGNDTLIWTR